MLQSLYLKLCETGLVLMFDMASAPKALGVVCQAALIGNRVCVCSINRVVRKLAVVRWSSEME